jgi:hypothetical protein
MARARGSAPDRELPCSGLGLDEEKRRARVVFVLEEREGESEKKQRKIVGNIAVHSRSLSLPLSLLVASLFQLSPP